MDVARPNTRRHRLGIVLTMLGVICTISLSALWVTHGGLLTQVLALVSTLILATGLTLFRPLRLIEEGP